jgi:hypothetical protein
MKFEFKEIQGLPPLAWCAQFTQFESLVTVYHGRAVEIVSDFFFEGAWAGEFSDGGFDDATACVGSGGKITASGVLFATPSHMLERLHTIRVGDQLIVSNSLAFTLAVINDACDIMYRFYHFDLMSNMKGLRKYKDRIKTRKGNTVRIYYHCNFLVQSDLSIKKLMKHLPMPFTSFEHYVGFLRRSVKDIYQNATDPVRRIQYTPLGTISSGYDSPACALLATEVGCNEAVTFSKARPGYESILDSGKDIGDLIGLKVIEFDREEYLEMPSYPEAEFLACGAGGEEVVFAPLEKVLPRRMFFTGYLGDAVWNRRSRTVGRELRMLYPGGSSFGEFRLRVGFIHLPLPAVGYINHRSIYAISNSDEMGPWSVDDHEYDRPIPRRLLEERGVPRQLFGQHKMAITQPLWNTERLEQYMGTNTYKEFVDFARRVPLFNGKLQSVMFGVGRFLYEANLRLNWRLDAVARRLGRRVSERPLVPERYSQPMGLNALTFHWGFEKILQRYKRALAQESRLEVGNEP